MRQERAVVLLSSGIDSATAAYHYQNRLDVRVDGLTIISHANHSNRDEVAAAKLVASSLAVHDHTVIDLTSLGSIFRDTTTIFAVGGSINECTGYRHRGATLGVELMHMMACSFALERDIHRVVWSIHQDDLTVAESRASLIAYTHAMESLVLMRTQQQVTIELPFIDKHKTDVLEYAYELGVPVTETVSCSASTDGRPCLSCRQCQLRTEALQRVEQPIYA